MAERVDQFVLFLQVLQAIGIVRDFFFPVFSEECCICEL